MGYNKFELRKKKKNDVDENNKEERFFWIKLPGFIVLGLIYIDETKKELCDDEIKCSKKGRITNW